jgi:4'-phosphopantetheinyl transferase
VNKPNYNTRPHRPRFFGDNELHVWRINLTSGRDLLYDDALSTDELERAGTFRRPVDRSRYVSARAGLRNIISMYLNICPEDVRFVYNEYGKPELDRKFHRDTVHFNLSRSGNIAVIAVRERGAVGVDVEFIDPNFPFMSVAEKYFPPITVKRLRQLASDSARSIFFDLWTGIEAYGKGKGSGLSESICLDHLIPATATIGDHAAQRLSQCTDWSVTNIFAGRDYAAAVATRDPVSCFRYWEACR